MSADDLTIRALRPDEVGSLRVMILALARYEKLEHLCTGTEADLHDALFASPPAAEAAVASHREGLVGFALFFPTFSTFLARRGLWLEDLFVLPEARGRGVGKALLRHVAAIAAQRGCGRLEWSVLDWNVPAIRFYEGLGATVMPDWRIARVTGSAIGRLADGREHGDGTILGR